MLKIGANDMWKNQQIHLQNVLQKLFTGKEAEYNARKQANIVSPHNNNNNNNNKDINNNNIDYKNIKKYLELDVWFPQMNLGFEFQDPYHFMTLWFSQQPLHVIQQRDYVKSEYARRKEITLIVVPCWWDGSVESLVNVIRFSRPDLLVNYNNQLVDLFPLNPHLGFFSAPKVPGVGELMLASFPVKENFTRNISLLNPWWMGEKYDGIRFCWHPGEHVTYSRHGVPLELPLWKHFSVPEFVDGELWSGRGLFSSVMNWVLSSSSDTGHFSDLRMIAFDLPNCEQRFESRFKQLHHLINHQHPFAIIPARQQCTDPKSLSVMLQDMLEQGGEGVMVQLHNSPYTRGRSREVIKLKASRGDREGLVVSILDDNSLVLQLPDETIIEVPGKIEGEGEGRREEVPQQGDVVTFSYDIRNKAMINPQVIRVRKDLDWQDVVLAHFHDLSPNKETNLALGISTSLNEYWKSKRGRYTRIVLENFARSKNLDPLLAETWYSIPRQSVMGIHGIQTTLVYFNGWTNTLRHVFPEIQFEEEKLSQVYTTKFWNSTENHQKFFLDFAAKSGFDPLIPDNWYSIMQTPLFESVQRKVFSLSRQGYNLYDALTQAFPEVPFDKKQFSSVHKAFSLLIFHKPDPRKFFDHFAQTKNFDTLNPENWYAITREMIGLNKKGRSLLKYYGGSLFKALEIAYPNIGINEKKFLPSLDASKRIWRKTLIDFAKANGFSPHDPNNWYSTSSFSIEQHKRSKAVLQNYQGKDKLAQALVDLFPDVVFDSSRFMAERERIYDSSAKRREFLLYFAKKMGFSPYDPDKWHATTTQSVIKEGGRAMLEYYQGRNKLAHAIADLFPNIGYGKIAQT